MTLTHHCEDGRKEGLGLALGLVGVIAFSLTLPMTRIAVTQLDPGFVAFGRMALAGLLALVGLLLTRAPRPQRSDLGMLAASAAGIVVGFPLLSSLAMNSIPANRGGIIVGALPFATALAAAALLRERHSLQFWLCAAVGSGLVIVFALSDALDSSAALSAGNLWMLAAVAACAVGYAAGGGLAKRIGAIAAILWALVLALPLTLPVAAWLAWTTPPIADARAWSAFAYVTLVSQLFGFFAWYAGLARGGVARVGQVQLLQVFFTLGFAALLAGERVDGSTWLFALAVAATLVLGRSDRPHSSRTVTPKEHQ